MGPKYNVNTRVYKCTLNIFKNIFVHFKSVGTSHRNNQVVTIFVIDLT